MFSYADCARMADAIYHVRSASPDTQDGREALRLVKAQLVAVFEDDAVLYRTAIWRKAGWSAFVVRGTVPNPMTPANLTQDILMKLGSNVPFDLVRRSVRDIEATIHPGTAARWIVVGHSLGGAVAQVLGFLYGVPFVTLNAPGMRYDVVRRGWVKTMAELSGGVGSTLLSMVPGVRDLYDGAVRRTPGLDNSYDAARAELGRMIGLHVSNTRSTASHNPDTQLGFNIANDRDTIHRLTGPPIGNPFMSANFVPDYYKVPAYVQFFRALANTAPIVEIGQAAMDVLRYHDSRALADYIDGLNWGTENPVSASVTTDGRVQYFAPSYMSAPGWGDQPRPR